MRRVVLALTVAAVVAVMMALSAGTAFAKLGAGCQGLSNAFTHSSNAKVLEQAVRQCD